MEKRLLIILMKKRTASAIEVQKYLTNYGCMIKTRLGIHDGVLDQCSDGGLIILELVGESKKCHELSNSLAVLEGVSTQLVELSV